MESADCFCSGDQRDRSQKVPASRYREGAHRIYFLASFREPGWRLSPNPAFRYRSCRATPAPMRFARVVRRPQSRHAWLVSVTPDELRFRRLPRLQPKSGEAESCNRHIVGTNLEHKSSFIRIQMLDSSRGIPVAKPQPLPALPADAIPNF